MVKHISHHARRDLGSEAQRGRVDTHYGVARRLRTDDERVEGFLKLCCRGVQQCSVGLHTGSRDTRPKVAAAIRTSDDASVQRCD
jgi:hypothetical protein